MSKIAVLGTGLSGLIGSKFVSDFSEKYLCTNLDLSQSENPVDITDFQQVLKSFEASPAEVVLHFAAFTDVTRAWEQKDDKSGLAYKVNVIGTENIAKAAAQTQKHLIHISTAYVFNGEKDESYTEFDTIEPIEWYGQTKAWAEEEVQNSEGNWTILRIDQPFRSDSFSRLDVAHKIIAGLNSGSLYPQFTNHFFGPTFIDDFVKVIDWVIRTRPTGVYHATSGEKWSDYDFAVALQQALHLPGSIEKGDIYEYLKTFKRPYQKNTSLDCTKLKSEIDFEMHTIKTSLQTLHKI